MGIFCVIIAGLIPSPPQSSPFWLVLTEEYTPIFAAAIVTVVLARSGFSQKMTEYRRDTVDMLRLRSETLEKELADSRLEIQDMMRDLRMRERRIEALEDEVDGLRHGTAPRPARSRHAPRADGPLPPHAPDVDDPS